MYETIDDPYCYPGTNVLRNKLGLTSQTELDAFESEISAQRADEPLPPGKLSYAHYCAIHRHLFQDVYDWAGKIRKVRISKGGSMFSYPEHIDREMKKLFAMLARDKFFRKTSPAEFAEQSAHFLAELNAIHPFREGNGRTQLTFLTILAEQAGHPLDLNRLDPAAIMKAIIESFAGQEARLEKLIRDLMAKDAG